MESRPKITVSVKNDSQCERVINLFDSKYSQEGVAINYTKDDQSVQDAASLFEKPCHISFTRIYFISCPQGYTEKQIAEKLDWKVKTTGMSGTNAGKVVESPLSFFVRRIDNKTNAGENQRFYMVGRNAIATFKAPPNAELKIDMYYLKIGA